jgi:hypothetical protein
MASKELINLVKELSQCIIKGRDSIQANERNEEWTKIALIVPLLEALGWDRCTDIGYESSPPEIEDRLDFILKCQPLIGIEAKGLDVPSPRDHNHQYIKKGLEQCKARGASYFIWTNGDCWQFFSLALLKAPFYEITLTIEGQKVDEADIANKFHIIEKEIFKYNPNVFDEAISANWKKTAMPDAFNKIQQDSNDLVKLIREALPTDLEIRDEDILNFVRGLKPSDLPTGYSPTTPRQPKKIRSFPEEWNELLNSMEPYYIKGREDLRRETYRRLAVYLISENYKPWPKTTTWSIVGLTKDQKKEGGHIIGYFKKWGFIEVEGDKNKRVEASVPFLKQLLEKMQLL